MSFEKQNVNGSNGEIDLKEIMGTIYKYKFSILFITALFTIGAFIYTYYKPNIYQTESTVEIGSSSKNSITKDDILSAAFDGGMNADSLETEIAIIRSRNLILKAMKRVDMVNHIFGLNEFYKKSELYDDSPIKVRLYKGVKLKFNIEPIDENHFLLQLDGSEKTIKGEFGKLIDTKRFKIRIDRVSDMDIFKYKRYIFFRNDSLQTAEFLKAKLNVMPLSKNANVLSVSMEDNIPIRVRDFINSLTNIYIEENIEQRTKEATQVLAFINRQLKIIEEKLRSSESKLENFKKREHTVDISQNAQDISKKLSEYESKSAIVQMQIDILKSILKKVSTGRDLETVSLAGLDIENKNISNLIGRLQETLIKKRELSAVYTNFHPEIKKINEEIRQLKVMISHSIRNTLNILMSKQELIQKEIAKFKRELKKLPKIQRDYLSLERRFVFNEKFYSYLLQKKTEAEIKKAATVSQIRVIDEALLPTEPIKPKRNLILVMGVVLGLILGIIIALIRAHLDDTIKDVEELEKLTDLPILGTIPHDKAIEKLVVIEKPKSAVTESFRNIRTNLQFMVNNKRGYTVVVTSTIAGEGKTTISNNLGAILSLINKRVIIVDYDLRKPNIHNAFNITSPMGLSEYLSNRVVAIEDIITKTNLKNLDIIQSGEIPPNPTELIACRRSHELIYQLQEVYDVVILDTPPVGLVTDAKLLLEHADTTIYILRANYSKKEFIKMAESIKRQHSSNLGIVLNDIKLPNDAYKYGYYEEK